MTSSAGAQDAARRAAAAAASGARPSPPGVAPTVIAPTPRQRALVPLAWGLSALVLTLVLPLSALTVLVLTGAVAGLSWLLAGRSAVLVGSTEVVVRRPVGRLVLPLTDLRGVERRKPVLTERAELVRLDGRRIPLPAPQHGPLPALRDPAFDERITLLRYRVAKGPRPSGS